MSIVRTLIVICFLSVLPSLVFAQSKATWAPDLESSLRYKNMSQQLLQEPERFDYGTFRGYYASSDMYAPIGEEIKNRMVELAYTIETTIDDPELVGNAMREYQSYVTSHLAHIGIVSLALSFSRDNPKFGDPVFLYGVQQSLLLDVLNSGDGRSLMRAYDVITLDEEVMLISALKLGKVVSNDRHEGILYYTMHDYVDSQTGAGKTTFVNTTLPMKYLAAKSDVETRVVLP